MGQGLGQWLGVRAGRRRVTRGRRLLETVTAECVCQFGGRFHQRKFASFSSARWPSGLRRQLKAIITKPLTGSMVQFAGPKGRGFKSHSGQLSFCRLRQAVALLPILPPVHSFPSGRRRDFSLAGREPRHRAEAPDPLSKAATAPVRGFGEGTSSLEGLGFSCSVGDSKQGGCEETDLKLVTNGS